MTSWRYHELLFSSDSEMKPRLDHVSNVVVATRPRSCRLGILLRTGQSKIEGEGIQWCVSGSNHSGCWTAGQTCNYPKRHSYDFLVIAGGDALQIVVEVQHCNSAGGYRPDSVAVSTLTLSSITSFHALSLPRPVSTGPACIRPNLLRSWTPVCSFAHESP